MKIKITALAFAILALFQSCASKRIKEKPNYNLSGKEAEIEFAKYNLRFVNIHRGGFSEESPLRTFNTQEFLPLMKEISPRSLEMLEKLN